MTQWVENPAGGRPRGPRAVVRAWYEVLVHPRDFFAEAVAPGDQGPGLVFAVAVTLVAATTTVAVDPSVIGDVGGRPVLGAALVVGLVALLVAPAVLHLVAALQTLLLVLVADERGGVSETVQVIGYATAPCALAGVPVPGLVVLATLYGAILLVEGTAAVHDLPRWKALVVGAVPAVVVFGYGYGGFAAASATLAGGPI